MSPIRWSTVWAAMLAVAWAAGCGREAPPDIKEYVPAPVAKATTQPAKAETEEPETPSEQAPVEAAPPPQVAAPAAAPVATRVEVAPTAPPPAAAAAPTIVGSWLVVEMARQGQPMPMPQGMSMHLTFEEGGTVSMAMSMPGMPEPQTRKGSYSVSGEQITFTMDNDTKTGPLHFEGNSRATIEVDEMRMTLARD